jgi:hypothetical protein
MLEKHLFDRTIINWAEIKYSLHSDYYLFYGTPVSDTNFWSGLEHQECYTTPGLIWPEQWTHHYYYSIQNEKYIYWLIMEKLFGPQQKGREFKCCLFC